MPEAGDIYIGTTGNEVLFSEWGQELTISIREEERTGKTADGSIVSDLICVKYDFTIDYSYVDDDVLSTIISQYELHAGLNFKLYTSPTTWFLNDDDEIPVVKFSPFTRKQFVLTDPILWSGLKLVFQEI